MRTGRIIVLSLLPITAAMIGVGVLGIIAKRRPSLTTEQCAGLGQERMNQKNYARALHYFGLAASQEPNEQARCDYHWAAAEAAHRLQDVRKAFEHAQAAWQGGRKDAAVLGALVSWTPGLTSNDDRLAYGLRLLKEMKEEMKGAPPDEASQDSGGSRRAAKSRATSSDDVAGSAAPPKSPDGADDPPEVRELRGDLYFGVGEFTRALEIWKELFAAAPRAALLLKLADAHARLGEESEARDLLDAPEHRKLFDARCYEKLALLKLLEDKSKEGTELFLEAEREGKYDDRIRLSHATELVLLGERKEAARVLAPLVEPVAGQDAGSDLRRSARLLLAYINGDDGDRAVLESLSKQAAATVAAAAAGSNPPPEDAGEKAFHEYLLVRTTDRAQALKLIKEARDSGLSHPVIVLQHARELALAKNYKESAAAYEALAKTAPIWARNPLVMTEFAAVLSRAGDKDRALALVSSLHRRKLASRASLELFRDLAFEKNLLKESQAAQKSLEEIYPNNPDIQRDGAMLLSRQGEVDRAAQILSDLAQKHPDRQDFELGRIAILLDQGKLQEVLAGCDKSRASGPALSLLKARALVRLARFEEAESLYAAAWEADKSDRVALEHGSLLLSLGRADKADAAFAEVLARDAGNAPANLGRAVAAFLRQDLVTARKYLEKAFEAGIAIAYAHVLSARIDLFEHRPEQALASCLKALAISPTDVDAKFVQGNALLELGRLKEAEEVLSDCLNSAPGAVQVMLALAAARSGLEKNADALKLVDEALAKDPDNVEAKRLRFENLARAGRSDNAEKYLEEISASLAPEQAVQYRALLLTLAGKREEAASMLEKHTKAPEIARQWASLKIEIGKTEGLTESLDELGLAASDWMELALFADSKKRFDLSAPWYKRALASTPESSKLHPILLNNCAWALIQAESLSGETLREAISLCEKADKLLPRNTNVLDTYAEALCRADKFEDCVTLLERSRSAFERNPQLFYVLGNAYDKCGDKPRALRAFETCLRLVEAGEPMARAATKGELENRIQTLRQPGR